METVLRIGNKVGFVPYQVTSIDGTIAFDRGLKAKVQFFANLVLLAVYELFLAFQMVKVLFGTELPFVFRVNAIYVSLVYLAFNLNHLISLQHFGSYHVFWNEFKAVDAATKRIASTLGEERAFKKSRKLSVILMFGGLAWVLASSLRAAKIFIRPESPELPTSVFPSPRALPFSAKLVFAILQLNVTGFHTYAVLLHGGVITTYMFSLFPVLELITLKPSGGRQLGLAMVKPELIRQINTRLSILQTCYNSTFKMWPLGFELSSLLYIIFRLFLAVVTVNGKDFIVAAVFLLAVISVFRGFAQVYENSRDALNSWRIIVAPRWFPQYRKACTPLKVTVGNFFFVDKQLILTLFSVVILNTTSLVLTYKDK